VGCKATQEDVDKIRASVEGSDMVFITAGLGGGTGTGEPPSPPRCAKKWEFSPWLWSPNLSLLKGKCAIDSPRRD